MKTFAYTLGIFAVLLYACDKIENPKIPQYEYDTSLYPGEGHYVQPNFDPLNGDKKRVVIEDYTGHTCGNCPSAAVILDNLANDYPDELIPIAVHSSNTAEQGNSFQFPRPSGDKYRTDFRLPASNTYGKDFNINSNPLGLVNRKINNLG
ncbi:MAG: hypothetical protein OXT06_17595, partial [Rhodospirillaceae bacterium]|nr:hypothetical protein [Rhodospirillaceae bacterium]